MANADSTYPTILIIRADMPDSVQDPRSAEKQEQQLEADLAFVQAMLLQSDPRPETWLNENGLVSRFLTVDDAFEAACALQQAWTERGQGSTSTRLRMLLDRATEAPTGNSGEYLAGQANASREHILEQAFPGQIIAPKSIIGRLSEISHARLQLVEQATAEQTMGVELYQVICNEATITRIALSTLHQENNSGPHCLCLRWRDNTMTLQPGNPELTIGRGDDSDIRIDSDLTSRIHAHLSFHETNFVLEDRSTNGTFVRIDQDDEVYLHNEQIVLRGSGVISLGRRIQGGRGKLIYFNLTTRQE
jgi:hypothetical protein